MLSSTILVTGGAGFIGSHLVDALLDKGYAVRVLDNLSSGKRSNLPLQHPHLEIIEGDVSDAALVARCITDCRAVAHLAGIATVQASVENPVNSHQSNFIGTLNVCEAMREQAIKRVVYASSAAVYGNYVEGLVIDEDLPKAPLTPYAIDKLASEYYLEFYQREHGLTPAVFRLFNVFGPRQDPYSPYSGVISIFTERALQRLPISVYGDGEQTRDFIYINDLIDLLIQALELPEITVGACNVGLGQATSLNHLLAEIGRILGGLPEINYLAARHGDIRHSRANITRLHRHYQCSQATPVVVGLSRLLGHS